jgi:hypothetical protein
MQFYGTRGLGSRAHYTLEGTEHKGLGFRVEGVEGVERLTAQGFRV